MENTDIRCHADTRTIRIVSSVSTVPLKDPAYLDTSGVQGMPGVGRHFVPANRIVTSHATALTWQTGAETSVLFMPTHQDNNPVLLSACPCRVLEICYPETGPWHLHRCWWHHFALWISRCNILLRIMYVNK